MPLDWPDDIERLSDDEWVARIVFDPRSLSDDGQEISPAAFMLRDIPSGAERYLSVHRTSLSPMTNELAHSMIKNPPVGNDICGYAHLMVRYAHRNNVAFHIVVAACPTKRLPHHAGIHIGVENRMFAGAGDCSAPSFVRAAEYLAKVSDFKRFYE